MNRVSGNLEAFADNVYRFAVTLVRNPHRAEDLTQETLLRAFRAASKDVDFESRFASRNDRKAWLFQILVNLVRDQSRKSNRESELVNESEVVGEHNSPIQELLIKEQHLQVMDWMSRLPNQQRNVLHLRAVEEFSIAEISDLLAISANAVKANLSIARKRMREMMNPNLDAVQNVHE